MSKMQTAAFAATLFALSFAAQAAEESVTAACKGAEGYAQSFEGRRTFLWKPEHLQRARESVAAGALQAASKALLDSAQRALAAKPYTVVDKIRLPASGDPHDYTSLGPYWWPDPARPHGRPYVRRDGEVNPERDGDAYDLADLEKMSQDVQALSLAYYFTGESRYAAKAASLIRTWFLDADTRMNPNFTHAQSIPGRVAGRAEGVIDAHRLTRVVESIGLIMPSGELTDAELRSLKAWFGDLVDWMATSPIAMAEKAKTNNHGLYYDLLISHFALFAGDDDIARKTIAAAGTKRLEPQIDGKGGMPEELQRTRSMHYTAWTLTAAMDLADLARCVGVDLWNYPSASNSRLRSAVDFVAPYVGNEQAWPWPELDKSENDGIYEALIRAGWAWDEPRYMQLARGYAKRYARLRLNLVLPAFPEP